MLKQFKNGLVQGLGFLLILGLGGISYAAWTALSTETDGGTLTSTKWNAVINRLNSIDQKQLPTAWVNFDGSSCTGGAGANECIIRDSYNVSKVIRTGIGNYDIYFSTSMDNTNYIVNVGQLTPASGIGGESYRNRLVNKVSVGTINYTSWVDIEASVLIFGGKN